MPDSQSKDMVRELEKRNKPVTFVSLAVEDHWLAQSATRTQMLKELDELLNANLRKE